MLLYSYKLICFIKRGSVKFDEEYTNTQQYQQHQMKRNRTNFPSKGKDGTCRILSCVHVGKYFKRLDCHLKRCHKEITRAMNDCLTMPTLKHEIECKNGSKCMLHSCKKQVKHLERHLLNVHKMTYATYLEETKSSDSITPLERTRTPKKHNRLSNLGTTSYPKSKNEVIVPDTPDWADNKKLNMKDDTYKVPSADLVTRDLSTTFDSELTESKECLRFLTHNTSSYGVCSLLLYLKDHPNRSIKDYHDTKLRQEVFGAVSLSFLRNVYDKRCELFSHYKKLGCFPYRGGKRVVSCLACEEDGKCNCPEISPLFYVYCRYRCRSSFDCTKCKRSLDHNFHDCYDFFFCNTCDEHARRTRLSSSALLLWKGVWGF